MDKQQIQYIFDRYISIFLYGSRNISALMSDQLMEELSLEQFSLVRILYQNRSMRASELAEQLLVHKSAITAKVEKLVKKGLVERVRDEDDRRNVYLHLSPTGKELYESLATKIDEFMEDILKEIPKDEMESFLNVYEKIADYIENYEGDRK
ncbi:MarR family winged helix-turn-helix transcriptional regulator [Lederbergia graminis]|uniref:MarR family winged helix-turn-helix transcriptional regulator n=1 Tax=Lederbergia graminis TaxID=735518 RepID=A0ABW0LHP2_9BACI|nr:MarR family transcriptional regulator [Bacillaceae bacterium]